MKELAIKRCLDDETRKSGVIINGDIYSLHITGNDEVIITDNNDYSKIYRIETLELYSETQIEEMKSWGNMKGW